MKDYYDLWKLSEDPKVDPGLCRQAIARTFERRETPVPTSVPEGLSDAFANDDAKLKQWHAFLRKNRLTCDGISFAEIVARLRTLRWNRLLGIRSGCFGQCSVGARMSMREGLRSPPVRGGGCWRLRMILS